MKNIILYKSPDDSSDNLINAVHTGGYGCTVRIEHEKDRVKKYISRRSCDILITTKIEYDLIDLHHKINPIGYRMLITDKPMEIYSEELNKREHIIVDHIVAYTPASYLTKLEIVATLQKILKKQIFGLDKYLKGGTNIVMKEVIGPSYRDQLNVEVMNYANFCKVGSYRSKLAFSISEELLMNATYDAPHAAGITKYGDIRSKQDIVLDPEHRSLLSFGCDGDILAIGVKDPFGKLKREKYFQYLKKVLERGDSSKIIDVKKDGAGLGLFKILFSSHSLICNICEGRYTEVIALIDLNTKVKCFSRMTRSIHYFEQNEPIIER